MIKRYTYNLVLAHSSDGGSKSKYSGGFKIINGRKNNTSEYNHDYYQKNKHKWKKDANSGRPVMAPTASGKVTGHDKVHDMSSAIDAQNAANKKLMTFDDAKYRYVTTNSDFKSARQDIVDGARMFSAHPGIRETENYINVCRNYANTVDRLSKDFDNLGNNYRRENFERGVRNAYKKKDKYDYLI